MNRGVTANLEEDTLTLTNQEGQTQTFEVVSNGDERKLDIKQSGRTTFTYNFQNGVQVEVITPGDFSLGGSFVIKVSEKETQAYIGKLANGQGDPLIIALQKQTEKKPPVVHVVHGGKNKKKTIRRSKKKQSKKSRKGRRNI